MIETLLIMWRESLEAALIVGILLTYLARSGERAGMRYVWAGALGAVVAAVAMGVASNGAAARLGPDAQELLQAGVLLLAVGVLSWMVVWMHRNARQMGGDLRRRADRALATGRLVGLAAIAFAAVFREGVEAVLFLWGVVVQRADASAPALLAAGVAGAGLAAATAWLFFRGFAFLNLQTFFRVTGILLLLVAAGLLTAGVNKLIGLGYPRSSRCSPSRPTCPPWAGRCTAPTWRRAARRSGGRRGRRPESLAPPCPWARAVMR